MRTGTHLFLAVVLLCLVSAFSESRGYFKEGADDMKKEDSVDYEMEMSYRLEGAYSPYKYIQIELNSTGDAKLSYRLYREYAVGKDEEIEKVIRFKADEDAIEKLVDLHQSVDFFNIELTDINKDEIQVTDVGTTILSYRCGKKKRILSYGYVENNPLQELIKFYWQLAREYLPR